VGVLVGGTALAHGITLCIACAVTSLYASRLQCTCCVYSLLSIISVAACLRFDVAVSIPHRDTDAANLLALALGCALVVSLLVAVRCCWSRSRLPGG